jgi:hypothetical protein
MSTLPTLEIQHPENYYRFAILSPPILLADNFLPDGDMSSCRALASYSGILRARMRRPHPHTTKERQPMPTV